MVVVADAQSAGRGRLDRTWTSPAGNLYASTVIDVRVPARLLPACSLAVAVALAETLEQFGAAPKLKWPNDVVIGRAKLAGILLEHQDRGLIVGTGINVLTAPPGERRATTLATLGIRTTPVAVLEAFLPRLRVWLGSMERAGFAPIRAAWLARAAGLGAALRVTLADRILEGRHGGIDDVGALVVETAGGPVAVAVGDVELVRSRETE